MSWKNPIDVFWTSSVEPRIFMLYFLAQLGQGLPWTALSLMLTRDIVSIAKSRLGVETGLRSSEQLLRHLLRSLVFQGLSIFFMLMTSSCLVTSPIPSPF